MEEFEFKKDFWLEVQRDFLENPTTSYFCNCSSLFKYYWTNDYDDHKIIRKLASDFLTSMNNTYWTWNYSNILFETPKDVRSAKSEDMRQIRLQFLEWVINNTKD